MAKSPGRVTDRERIEWLERRADGRPTIARGPSGLVFVSVHSDRPVCGEGATLREAIDRAMMAEGGEAGCLPAS